MTTTPTSLGMLKLAVSPARDPEYIRLVVEQIQALPAVVRVRADGATNQIEVMFEQPAEGLLRQIHVALRMAGSEIVAGKSF